METKTRLQKWWDEAFVKKPKPAASALLRFLRKPKRAPVFSDKRMQRGVQVAVEKKQRPARLAFIRDSQRQAVEIALQRREDYLRRRGKRWRALVEGAGPRAFVEAMRAQGLSAEIGL